MSYPPAGHESPTPRARALAGNGTREEDPSENHEDPSENHGETSEEDRPETPEVNRSPEKPSKPVSPHTIPELTEGTRLLGEYQGAGYQEPRYLVSRADQQMVLVSPLLYRTAEALDGRRNIAAAADHVSSVSGQNVTPENVQFLIESKLQPLGIASLDPTQPQHKLPRASPLLALSLRGVIVPAPVARVLAVIFAPLYYPPIIFFFLAALIGVDVWLAMQGKIDPAINATVASPLFVLPTIGLLIASTLFHEIGHAAACRYGGARPGRIGFGLIIIFPAFYTNVTDAYRLNRRGRLRTDLGGIYFNVIFIVGAAAAYYYTNYTPLVVALVLSHFSAVQQLLPLIRLDGYYILGDLVGVPNLFGHVKPILKSITSREARSHPMVAQLRPKVRIMVTAWVLVVVPVLVLGLSLLLYRIPAYASTAWVSGNNYFDLAQNSVANGNYAMATLAGISIATLVLPWVGLAVLLVRMSKRLSGPISRKIRGSASPSVQPAGGPSTAASRAGTRAAGRGPRRSGRSTRKRGKHRRRRAFLR